MHPDQAEISNAPKIPSTLLRTFKEEDHAEAFIRGKIRFGLLSGYRDAEGSRKDETEGRVLLDWKLPNPVHCDRSSMNPYYILCTSGPEVNRCCIKKFGLYIVRVSEPVELLKRIEVVWQRHALASGRSIIAPAVYNKGALLEPTPGLGPPVSYSYAQKPDSYSEEMEYRYVPTCISDLIRLKNFAISNGRQPGGLDDHLTLTLDDCSDICSLLECP